MLAQKWQVVIGKPRSGGVKQHCAMRLPRLSTMRRLLSTTSSIELVNQRTKMATCCPTDASGQHRHRLPRDVTGRRPHLGMEALCRGPCPGETWRKMRRRHCWKEATPTTARASAASGRRTSPARETAAAGSREKGGARRRTGPCRSLPARVPQAPGTPVEELIVLPSQQVASVRDLSRQ